MVSLKIPAFKSAFPIKTIAKGKSTIRKEFKHVNCSDNEIGKYFRDGNAATMALLELNERSWEYQFEFAVEMSKQCKMVMGDDYGMKEAFDVFETWIRVNPYSPVRRFPLLTDILFLTNLYPLAQRVVCSSEALQFALSYSHAVSRKRPLHKIPVDKSNPFGLDLLSQRQKALEMLVPEHISDKDLYDFEYDEWGNLIRVPSRLHLEMVCWGYTPDEMGIWECGHREFSERFNGVL